MPENLNIPKASFGISNDFVCGFCISIFGMVRELRSIFIVFIHLNPSEGFKCQECNDRFNSLSATTKKCFIPYTHLEHEHPQRQVLELQLYQMQSIHLKSEYFKESYLLQAFNSSFILS